MDVVNLPFFYSLGHQLRTLANYQATADTRMDILIAAFPVTHAMRSLLEQYPDISALRTSFSTLESRFESARQWTRDRPSEQWHDEDSNADSLMLAVVSAAKDCETVLLAELPRITTYHPRKKGIYATQDLVSEAEKSLPPSVLQKINPVAKQEIRQAGQCLAFDLPTASGFHMMRATEAVLHDYYVTVCKPKNKKALGNWGAYILALYKSSENTGDAAVKEVLAILQQMKDSHRNLIMHPEMVLSEDDAHTLFEVSKGAIIAMGQRLKVLKVNDAKAKQQVA